MRVDADAPAARGPPRRPPAARRTALTADPSPPRARPTPSRAGPAAAAEPTRPAPTAPRATRQSARPVRWPALSRSREPTGPGAHHCSSVPSRQAGRGGGVVGARSGRCSSPTWPGARSRRRRRPGRSRARRARVASSARTRTGADGSPKTAVPTDTADAPASTNCSASSPVRDPADAEDRHRRQGRVHLPDAAHRDRPDRRPGQPAGGPGQHRAQRVRVDHQPEQRVDQGEPVRAGRDAGPGHGDDVGDVRATAWPAPGRRPAPRPAPRRPPGRPQRVAGEDLAAVLDVRAGDVHLDRDQRRRVPQPAGQLGVVGHAAAGDADHRAGAALGQPGQVVREEARRSPGFCRPIELSMPLGVSAIRGVGRPARGAQRDRLGHHRAERGHRRERLPAPGRRPRSRTRSAPGWAAGPRQRVPGRPSAPEVHAGGARPAALQRVAGRRPAAPAAGPAAPSAPAAPCRRRPSGPGRARTPDRPHRTGVIRVTPSSPTTGSTQVMHTPIPQAIDSSTATWHGSPYDAATAPTARSIGIGPHAYTASAPVRSSSSGSASATVPGTPVRAVVGGDASPRRRSAWPPARRRPGPGCRRRAGSPPGTPAPAARRPARTAAPSRTRRRPAGSRSARPAAGTASRAGRPRPAARPAAPRPATRCRGRARRPRTARSPRTPPIGVAR